MKKIVARSFFLKHLCFLALIVAYVLAVQLYFDFRAFFPADGSTTLIFVNAPLCTSSKTIAGR